MKFSGVSSFSNIHINFKLILVLVLFRRGRDGEGASPPICCFSFFSPVLAVPQTERLEQAISFFNLQTVFKLFKDLIALSYK